MTVRDNRGFAVAGTMVIASVFLTLAALLLALVSAPRQPSDAGNQADCISHLHAVGVALRIYYADHHEYPGPVVAAKDDPQLQTGGMTELYRQRYLTNVKALVCADDNSPKAQHPTQDPPGAVAELYSSYNVDDRNRPIYNYYGLDDDGIAVATRDAAPVGGRALPGPEDADYPALFNVNAPDDTIVTHCVHHRALTGDAALDVVLRLGGDVIRKPSGEVNWMVWW